MSPEFIAELREGYEMGEGDRARHNAVTNNSISSLALNRDIVRGEDGHFTHRIKSKGITNQKSSGRCWMFAGLNVIRPQVIREHRMAEFEFSTAYLQFWDKMEKSNLYLESVIELREASFLDREWEIVNRWSIGDGGWWNYVTGLIGKYGVVPSGVMPETHSSENTKVMNHVLGRLLRARAVRIIALHEGGAKIDALRSEKRAAMKDVYRFLAINLGEPPAEFEWRYRIRKKRGGGEENGEKNGEKNGASENWKVEEQDVSPMKSYTPQSFYREFVGVPLADYVCLYNDPKNDYGKHYYFKRSNNMVGHELMHFVNIESDTMKGIASVSIQANEPVWFAVNMGVDQSREHGIMAHKLYDYETLFGIDLRVSKADRTRFHAGASNHAMVLMGVDLADGKPNKWLVENSWGEEKGDKGTWTLYNRWFDEHVYTIIVHKRHVPAGVMERFKEDAIELPAWYPGARGISFP